MFGGELVSESACGHLGVEVLVHVDGKGLIGGGRPKPHIDTPAIDRITGARVGVGLVAPFKAPGMKADYGGHRPAPPPSA